MKKMSAIYTLHNKLNGQPQRYYAIRNVRELTEDVIRNNIAEQMKRGSDIMEMWIKTIEVVDGKGKVEYTINY